MGEPAESSEPEIWQKAKEAYWTLSGEQLRLMLWKVANGQDPDSVLVDEYVSNEHEEVLARRDLSGYMSTSAYDGGVIPTLESLHLDEGAIPMLGILWVQVMEEGKVRYYHRTAGSASCNEIVAMCERIKWDALKEADQPEDDDS